MAAISIGLLTIAMAIVLSNPLSEAFLALALCVPGLLMQDTVRMICFAEGRMRTAFFNDGIFLAVQIASYAVLASLGELSGYWLILGWGLGGYAAAAVGLTQLRCAPRPWRSPAWIRRNSDLIPAYVGDYLANRGTEQLTLLAILAAAGTPAVGAVTAARTLFAPLTTVQTGVNAFALPEAARLHRAGADRRLRGVVSAFALVMAGLMTSAGVLIALLPRDWGQALFAANWDAAAALVWPMTLFSVLNAVGFAFWLGAKARQRSREVFTARLAAGLVMMAAAWLGAQYGDGPGAVLGMALGGLILALTMARLVLILGPSPTDIREAGQHG